MPRIQNSNFKNECKLVSQNVLDLEAISLDITDFINSSIKKPVQKGDKVFIYNGNGKLIKIYSTLELGKEFFSMSNDSFYSLYGFNFVPDGKYWALSKRAAGKM